MITEIGVETLTCCACHDENVYDSRAEAKAEGWVRARGTWTCPACADDWRDEQQAAYGDQWPAAHEPAGVQVTNTELTWTVRIPEDGNPTVTKMPPGRLWETAATDLGAFLIEPVSPLGLAITKHRLLVDEDGRGKNRPLNQLASFLYGTHLHGVPIVGPALVCQTVMTDEGPDLAWLTRLDADLLCDRLLGLGS